MSRCISVITLYNPNEKHIENLKRIILQSDFVLVCDNSDVAKYKAVAVSIAPSKVIYCANNENLGLSIAFNKILMTNQYIDWQDDDYIVFYDQDSVINEHHNSCLIAEYANLIEKGINVGCLGPVFFDTSKNCVRKPRMYKQISKKSFEVDSIITSSMVCKFKVLKEVGFWNEKVFLDMADWDICWRIKDAGYRCVMTEATLLKHTVGEGTRNIGLLSLTIAKPFREYYQIRDSLYLLKEHYVPLKFRCKFYFWLSLRIILHLLFLDNKTERWYYIMLGRKHYNKGLTGALPKSDMWDEGGCF